MKTTAQPTQVHSAANSVESGMESAHMGSMAAPPVQLQAGQAMEMECGCAGCPSCQEASAKSQEPTTLCPENDLSSGSDPVSQALDVMMKAMSLHDQSGNVGEAQRLEQSMGVVEKLRGKETEPQAMQILQGLGQAAQGDASSMEQQKEQGKAGGEEEAPVQRFVFAIPVIVIGAAELYALAAAATALTAAYVISQTDIQPITLPFSRTRDRGGARRIRCTARSTGGENPPSHCPDRVFGTGSSRGEAQRNAKDTAPVECRKFYGHCGWVN